MTAMIWISKVYEKYASRHTETEFRASFVMWSSARNLLEPLQSGMNYSGAPRNRYEGRWVFFASTSQIDVMHSLLKRFSRKVLPNPALQAGIPGG